MGRGRHCSLIGLWSPPVAGINDVDVCLPAALCLHSNLMGHWGDPPQAVAAGLKALEKEGMVPVLNVQCALWQNMGE